MPKVNLLGIPVDVIDTQGLHERIAESIEQGRKDVLAYVNINAINIGQEDQAFREFLNRVSIVYCDGEGVRLGARLLGFRLPPRVELTYWIWELCAFCEQRGYSLFFLGATHDTVDQAVARVKKRFPRIKIVGWHHGYFDKHGLESDRVIGMINALKPNILIVGFGMPLQEHWISENLGRLHANIILPSGSMIDYTAGRKGLAPAWMANHGMEWLYRLFQEPGRLWRRYLLGNPLFIVRVLMQLIRGGK